MERWKRWNLSGDGVAELEVREVGPRERAVEEPEATRYPI
jgi:hypothetical protein